MTQQETPLEGRFLRPLGYSLTVLGLLFGLAAWLTPNHYPPWTSFHNEAAAFAALGILSLAALISFERIATPPTASYLFLLLILLILVQWAFGMISSFGDALVSSLYLAGLALAWWLGATTVLNSAERTALVLYSALIVVAAVISTYIALLQWLRLESLWGIFAADCGPGMRPFGNLGQPNHLGTLTLMACALCVLLYTEKKLTAWKFWCLLTFLSLGLALSESRSGRLGAFGIGVYLLWQSRKFATKSIQRGVWIWWALLTTLWLIRNQLSDLLLLQPSRDAQLTQDSARTVMWKQMFAAIEQSPWIGYGWRQTIVAQKTGALAQPGNLVTDYAHNIILDILIWVGVPIGLLLILLFACWIFRFSRTLTSRASHLLYASTLSFFVHSFFEFPFAYAYFLFPVGWAIGFLEKKEAKGPMPWPAQKKSSSWLPPSITAYILFFFLLCSIVEHDYLLAEEDYRIMRFELRKVGQRPADYQTPKLILLTQLSDLLKAGRIKPYVGMPPEDMELLRRVNQNQGWATLHLSYIVALGLNGHTDEAIVELKKLHALYGDTTYTQALHFLHEMQSDNAYSALRKIRTP